ncbi:MAG: trehalose-6-phosphate synthase, partial [Gemmatimonadaceae bacterium]
MRLSLRFIVPLVLVLAALAYSVMPLVDRLTFRWFGNDLRLRSVLVANTIDEPLRALIEANDAPGMRRFFARIAQDERIFALGFCPVQKTTAIATPTFPRKIKCAELNKFSAPADQILNEAQGPLLVSVMPVAAAGETLGNIVLVHDMSFVQRRSEETKKYLFYLFVALGVVISLITVVVAQLSWRGWVAGIRALMRGEGLLRPARRSDEGELQPIADDLRTLIRDLDAENRLRDEEQLAWTPETLRGILDRELRGQDVIMVSNREPYIHVSKGDSIVIQRPASGLVSAVEPIMRACSGTWIAHGS